MIKLDEIKIRNRAKEALEALEHWSRRLIDDKFVDKYGKNYFDYKSDNGQNLIKSSILSTVNGRVKSNPKRFPRKIDAIVMNDISYFLCKDSFYEELFSEVLSIGFSGQEEIKSRLNVLVDIRDKLSHGNPISYREAEKAICYSNDFIDCYKEYYKNIGRDKVYNVPFFIKVEDSLGRCIYRDVSNSTGLSFSEGATLRPGDTYKIWVEVDGSFPESFYRIIWRVDDKKVSTGNTFIFRPTIDMVSMIKLVECQLVTKRKWHRYGNCDDLFSVMIGEILPPIQDSY